METFSVLLAFCEGNAPVTGGVPFTKANDAEIWFFYICTDDQWKYWQGAVGKDILTHRSHWHIYASEKTVAIDLDKTNCRIFFHNTAFGMAMIKDQLKSIPQEFAKIRVPPFVKCSLVSLVRKKVTNSIAKTVANGK